MKIPKYLKKGRFPIIAINLSKGGKRKLEIINRIVDNLFDKDGLIVLKQEID